MKKIFTIRLIGFLGGVALLYHLLVLPRVSFSLCLFCCCCLFCTCMVFERWVINIDNSIRANADKKAKRYALCLSLLTALILFAIYVLNEWRLMRYSGPIRPSSWTDRVVFSEHFELMLPIAIRLGGSWDYGFLSGGMDPWCYVFADGILEMQPHESHLMAIGYFKQNGWLVIEDKNGWKGQKGKVTVKVESRRYTSSKTKISIEFFVMEQHDGK